MNKNDPLVSVVFSFRNEHEVLPELIRRVQSVFRPINTRYEMIFVNDASTDNSLQILEEARQTDPNIKVVNMSRRFGVTPCVLAGFRYSKGDVVVYMDADLQDPPEVIPRLIEAWKNGADVVHTVRTARRGENVVKMWITRQAYRLISMASDVSIKENAGDFKLISRRAVNEILRLDESDPFMRGLVVWVGFKQEYVEYERDARYAGETKFSLWRSLNPYKEFVRGITCFSDFPLYVAMFLGLFVLGMTVLYLAAIAIESMIGCKLSEHCWIIAVLLLMSGVTLLALGMFGIYIGKIHNETRRRPRYVVESLSGVEDSESRR